MDTIKTLDPEPFKYFCMTIGELPSSFVDSMSYYEMLAWLCNYLEKTVIPAINNNAEAVAEIQQKLVELKDYVDHYFDNLDVQTEINNKLDAMVEDGTMATIINQEIFGELNAAIAQNAADIDALEKKVDFANIGKMAQNFIYDTDETIICQGACYDSTNDVLYVYTPSDDNVNGRLDKFSLVSHSYLGSLENVPFYHGNGLAYANGNIYAATFYTDQLSATNKNLIKYNVATSQSQVLSPFSSLTYARIFGITAIDNTNLIAAFSEDADRKVSETHFVKYNTSTNAISEYTMDFNNFWTDRTATLCDIQYSNGHVYLLTAKNNFIFDFELNETTSTAKLVKMYSLPQYSSEGIYLGELEGIAIRPNPNDTTFTIVSATSFGDEYSILAHDISLQTDLMPYYESPIGASRRDVVDAIYLKGSATNLLEAGTEDLPFKKLNRALDYMNNNEFPVGDIYVLDNGTYLAGYQYGRRISIRWDAAYTPKIAISQLIDCDTYIRTTSRTGGGIIYSPSAVQHQIQIKGGTTSFTMLTLTACLVTTGNARLLVGSSTFDLEDAEAYAINAGVSYVQLRISAIENYTGAKPIYIGNNGVAIVGNSLSDSYTVATGGYVIVMDS